jgi:hypothetical protein
LEIFSSSPALRADQHSFQLWEIRASLTATGATVERIELDGGCRAERQDPGADIAAESWFVVGAGPSALEPVAAGAPFPAAAADEWRAAAAWASERLQKEFAGLQASLPVAEGGFSGAGLSVERSSAEIHIRVRAWRRGDDSPQGESVTGFRVRHDWSAPGVRGRTERSATALAELPWLANRDAFGETLARQHAALRQLSPAGTTSASLRDYRGPVILAGPAAAWLIHEMGHAALERLASHSSGPKGGLAIVDDAPSAPWPAGFAWDDAGRPAQRLVLWDATGSRDVRAAAPRRRASIREAAVPFLSFTFLAQTGADSHAAALSPPPGIPIVCSASSGRYDPLTGTILLEVEQILTESRGVLSSVAGNFTLLVTPDQAWSGACLSTPQTAFMPEQANCSRHGAVIAVMVGAQTIALDSVHLAQSESAS